MVKENSKVVRSRVAVKIDGVDYASRSDAAKALVAAGRSLPEAAKMTGMTYQTVYSVTKGADKVVVRRSNYRIVDLGKSGKRSAGEIAKKVGVSTSKVVAILKKAGVPVVSKEAVEKKKPVENSEPVKKIKKIKKSTVEHDNELIDMEKLRDLSVEFESEMVKEAALLEAMHDMSALG